MIVTIFGGGKAPKEIYDLAYELGKKIGAKGYTLKNGGTDGTMEASAKGCVEMGGKAIGAVVVNSGDKNLEMQNNCSTEILKFQTYRDRVAELMKTDRVIVLPGQLGTLDEMFVALVTAVVEQLPPVILLGEKNKKLLQYLKENNFLREEHMPFIEFCESIEDIDFLK